MNHIHIESVQGAQADCARLFTSRCHSIPTENVSQVTPFAEREENEMDQIIRTEPYTLEQLQQKYSLSISKAVDVIERFGGDRASIDKMMKRRHRNEVDAHQEPARSESC